MLPEISRLELEDKMRSGDPLSVVEVLPENYFASGHLPGALNLPLSALPSQARSLLPNPETEVVVYCSGPTCQNSHVAQLALTGLGYRKVRIFRGGKAEWTAAGNELTVSP
jgi:rhodanese-related sulfurtransferase